MLALLQSHPHTLLHVLPCNNLEVTLRMLTPMMGAQQAMTLKLQ